MNLSITLPRAMSLAVFFNLLLAGLAHAQASDAATVDNAGHDRLLWLFAATLGIVLCLAIWQLNRVRQAKRNREHSALSDSGKVQRDGPR